MDISLYADTLHSYINYQFIQEIINTSKFTIFEANLSVKCLEKIVDYYPRSDASDGIEQPASLFLVLYSILCPLWSAFGKPWSATDCRGYWRFFTFLLLNQEHGRDRAHCKILRKYCVFSSAIFILAASLRHRTQNDNTD